MSNIIKRKVIHLQSANPVLSLKETGLTHRYLTVAGQNILNMTGPCDTCRFLFSYVPDVKPQIPLPDLSSILEKGLKDIDETVIKTLEPLFPSGEYHVFLRDIKPRVVSAQYPDPYWESLPENSTAEIGGSFYSCETEPTKSGVPFFELVLPMWGQTSLVPEAVNQYVSSFANGGTSTAITFSHVHITRQAHGGNPTAQYLAHCLIDGHHKMAAAAKTKTTIRLLSFLPVGPKWASMDELAK